MSEWFFNAPAGLSDFRDPNVWHQEMVDESLGITVVLVANVLGKDPKQVTIQDLVNVAPELSYFDPTNRYLIEAGIDRTIPKTAETIAVQAWNGFPRLVRRLAPWTDFPPNDIDSDGSFRAVDTIGDEDHRRGVFVDQSGSVLDFPTRHRQDEYLEWTARRDDQGNITKVIFVAEGYDYFSKLFESDEKAVVEIYEEFTETTGIRVDDLRAQNGLYRRQNDGTLRTIATPGGFNPRNTLNIDPGIVHLSHRANSLGAEVNLAGVSALARSDANGKLVDASDEERLICCNQSGEPNRNSDPQISKQAYQQVIDSYIYTLANPVGLYIAGIDHEQLLMPDNKTIVPREWWKVVRGDDLWVEGKSRALRVELEVPSTENLTVSDLKLGGNNLIYPSQLAELLSVHLFVTRWKREDNLVGPIVPCLGTCCRIDNSETLLGSSTNECRLGSTLAFDDLLPKGPSSSGLLAGFIPQPISLTGKVPSKR
ncbi:hypothetical protein F9L33_09640 [Amylibacter sp. SFDW26]|uniref:hypothetical protein n=1 Tax=Amylibacter sp. SFDW26 TaxID=2652722 RepID=UPI0012628E42|nr:hypothetical protein [Amylibacter sp. SFDW26]KAB7613631.1 hypothetical protein F9L33_09640 [Amylibacter sp. SFDW26]